MQRKTIMVLGMHRSGTSALARMLSLLGCELPHTLMPESPSNPKGHWESNAIMSLNDDILQSAGTMWNDWLEFNPSWYESPVVDSFLTRASSVLEAEYGASPLFVLKDPRNCRLTRFWFNVLDQAGVMPLVVVPLRNPLEVVNSLEMRNGMHRDLAMLLWLRHVLDAENGSRGRRRVFMTFENLLDDWLGVADRLQDGLGISWPRQSALTAIEIENFLDRDSRHHVRSDESVQSNRMLSRWVRDTNAILGRWATSHENYQDHAKLDDIRQQLNAAGPVFGRLTFALLSEQQQNFELHAMLQAKEDQLAQINSEIAQLRDEQVSQQDQSGHTINDLETRVGNLEDARHELEIIKSELENDLATLRAHVEVVEADLRAALADKETGAAAFNAAREDVEILNQELDSLRHELANVQSTLRQREEEIAQTLSSLDAERQKIEQAEAARIEAEERHEASKAKLVEANAWVFRLAGDRRNADDQIALMQSRLNAKEKALGHANARLADIQSRHLDSTERQNLTRKIEDITKTLDMLRVEKQQAAQGWDDSRSEIVALSKLLQQSQTAMADLVKSSVIRGEVTERDASANTEILMLSRLLKQREDQLADTESSHEVKRLRHALTAREKAEDRVTRHAEWLEKVNAVVTGYPHWWAYMPKHMREKWQNGRLLRRGLFDAESYLSRYPDVLSSGIDPLRHYILHGIKEKRTF